MVPEKLGPFKIGRVLGRGGMGAVYEGTSETDNSVAAIKVLTSFLDEDEDAEVRLRFESEIETLKRLRHPNIVRLAGFGEEQGQLYYVMELVNGSSLLQELKKKRVFQWYEAAKIGLDICQALRHAHDRGVIHRDIKPANILLDQEGNAKLSDFGIARFFGSQQITDLHSIIGTLEYMSPEQSLAHPISSCSDLYSLGCVLYVLLTGKPPYTARSLPALLKAYKSSSPVSIRSIRHDVPENLEYLITDLLNMRPENRPRNALLVSKRLQALLQALMGTPDSIKVLPMTSAIHTGTISISLDDTSLIEENQRNSDTASDISAADTTASQAAPDSAENANESDYELDKRLLDTVSASAVSHSAAKSLQQGNVLLSKTLPIRPNKDEPLGEADYWTGTTQGKTVTQSLSSDSENPPAESVSKAPAKNQNAATRFVTVEERTLDPFEEDHRVVRPLFSLPMAVTSTLLMLIGLTVYYLLQPIPPERLFERITNTIKEDDVSGEYSPALLRSAQKDIDNFLSLYSNHPSAEQIRYYQDELNLLEQERRLERRTQFAGLKSLTPVERAYVEVLTSSSNNTEKMIEKLQAFINVFQSGKFPYSPSEKQRPAASNPVDICVELAQRRLKKLEQSVEEINSEQENVVRQRLKEAENLETAAPEHAEAIRRGIVELYQNHRWAKRIVEEAKQQLEK